MASHYKFCPNCGSPNVEWELPHTWSKWVCRECGYIGVLIIEEANMAVEIRRVYLEDKAKETSDREE